MSLSESRVFQRMTAGAEFVRESEWTLIYQKRGHRYRVSKFLDDGFSIDASAFRKRWPEMEPGMRMEFCSAFAAKSTWTPNETEILEVIMQDGSDEVWQPLALTFLRHPDRERVVRFLVNRLRDPLIEHRGAMLNYIQALGISGDHSAASAIKPFYDEFKKGLEAEANSGVPDDVFFGPIPYHAFFVAAGAMVKTDGSPDYEDEIRKFFNHPSEQVRWWAEHALGVEGPTTAKRKEECRYGV